MPTNLYVKESFSYWVSNPEDITATDTKHLEDALQTYPYCQTLQLLTAKAVNMHEPERTAEVIHRTAAYSLKRAVLRQLILKEFEWSNNLLARQLSSILPTDYEKEKYDSLKSHKIELPDLAKMATLDFDAIASRPPIDDSTLRENILQEDLQKLLGTDDLKAQRQTQMDIIDSFIDNENKIGPIRIDLNKHNDQEDLIKKRETDAPIKSIVSEGMAKILVRQGKIEKAIEMYEELILKKPEKSAYFADKIKELTNQ